MYSFIASGCIWPEPEAEIRILTLPGLLLLKPASASSFFAASGSYFTSNDGLPNHWLPGIDEALGRYHQPAQQHLQSGAVDREIGRLAHADVLPRRAVDHAECQVQLCG